MSMTRGKITAARRAAQRFVKACDAALERLDEEGMRSTTYRDPSAGWTPSPADYSYGSKETGTLRRVSMELTRSLADLRRRE